MNTRPHAAALISEARSGYPPERVFALEGRESEQATRTAAGGPSRRSVLLLSLAVAVLRYVYVVDRSSVSLSPDEYASLGIARFLAGGEFNMLTANTYRLGPGFLLAPWSWLFDDPALVVRLGLVTNAAIAGGTMFVLVPLVGRLTSFERTGTMFVSGVIAALPQSLEASAHLWAEPLVTLTFLGALGAVLRHLDQPSSSSALIALVWGTFGAASHGRLIPLTVLVGIVVVVHAFAVRRFGLATLAGGAAVVLFGAVTSLHRWVVRNVWEIPGGGNSEMTVLRRLTKPVEVLDAAAGQIWYQLAASALLVGFGVVELIRRSFLAGDEAMRRDARIVLVLTAPLVGVSFTFMSDVGRADHVLYGRYIDAVIWPVVAVGAHWVFRVRPVMSARRRRVAVGGTIVLFVDLALLVHQLHRHQIRLPGVNAMIAGIVPLSNWGSINALFVSALALVGTGLLFLAARGSILDQRTWGFIIVAVVVTLGFRLWAIQRPDAGRVAYGEKARTILDLEDGPPPGSEIGVLIMPIELDPAIPPFTQNVAIWSYQQYLPEYRFVLDRGIDDAVGPYVFAVDNDRLLTLEGGSILWKHPDVAMALWLEPPRDDDPIGSDG